VPARPQTKVGRYYSFMPAVPKERCVGGSRVPQLMGMRLG
jgi:hypothetical protein